MGCGTVSSSVSALHHRRAVCAEAHPGDHYPGHQYRVLSACCPGCPGEHPCAGSAAICPDPAGEAAGDERFSHGGRRIHLGGRGFHYGIIQRCPVLDFAAQTGGGGALAGGNLCCGLHFLPLRHGHSAARNLPAVQHPHEGTPVHHCPRAAAYPPGRPCVEAAGLRGTVPALVQSAGVAGLCAGREGHGNELRRGGDPAAWRAHPGGLFPGPAAAGDSQTHCFRDAPCLRRGRYQRAGAEYGEMEEAEGLGEYSMRCAVPCDSGGLCIESKAGRNRNGRKNANCWFSTHRDSRLPFPNTGRVYHRKKGEENPRTDR